VIRLNNLYEFLEGNFDHFLVLDEDRRVIHASDLFKKDYLPDDWVERETVLDELVTDSSLAAFRSGMAQARSGGRAVALFSPAHEGGLSIPLKAGYATTDDGGIYLFLGHVLEGLRRSTESEKDERIKELACLYRVMEWIEVSPTIGAFFTDLPKHLSPGMLSPEEVVVYSIYEGVEYGQKPASNNYISVRLVVGGEEKGEIRVGYLDDQHELLPEEQKMLNEIGRTLDFALERREYRDKLAVVNSYLDRVSGSWEEAKGRLETMFRAIPDDVVLIDKNRKIVMTNREDIPPEKHCYEGIFGRRKPCDDCRLARILKDKAPIMLSIRHEDKYFQVHAMPVYNKDQEVDGILEFYRDVTLERTYEQQLQQADKLASLGQLVSGIGHEINNPNQFIRGNIKIMRQALEDMLPIVDKYHEANPELKIARLNYDFFREHIMTLVNDMGHGSERIKAIVEGLRTFARKDEGLLVDTVDINTLVEASTRLVHNEVHKRAEISLALTPNLPAFIGNSQKIEQVLINLLVNSGQAMPDDRKGLIKVSTRAENGHVVVEVKDDGHGMSEKTLRQIFDPFFTTKRAKGGTGLGLAIAFKIIEEHKGKISVTSELGTGTTFTIRIPAGKGTGTSGEDR
jgi:signal transduction histidine kinase